MHCTSICMSSNSMSQIFKIVFQTEYINIFVLCGVFFSRSVQLKGSFSDKKASVVKSETVKSESEIWRECEWVLSSVFTGGWFWTVPWEANEYHYFLLSWKDFHSRGISGM